MYCKGETWIKIETNVKGWRIYTSVRLEYSLLLVPFLLLVQHVLQDGRLRSISRSWAEGWKSEETRKHLFENGVAPIESICESDEWIQTSFVNLILRFIVKIQCEVHTCLHMDVATVLMNAWSSAMPDIEIFIKQLLKLWFIHTQSYHMTSEDFNLLHWLQYFHFHYIDKNHWVILQEFTLCVHLNRFGTSRVWVT